VGQIEAIEGPPTLEAEIASIYGEHAVVVRQRCLRLTGSAVAADDLVQETFARFLARFRDLPDDLNVRGYLLATARNIWVNQVRQQRNVMSLEVDEGRTLDDRIENDPLRALLLAEQRGDVQRGAAGLTERQRLALTLRELDDRSYAEIGSELGLQTNAVAQVVWRARTQLRRSLRRSQIDVGALPDDCRARLDVISDLVDETPSSDTAALKAHMEDCTNCRRTLSAFQQAGSRLRAVLPLVPLSAVAARIGTALQEGVGIPSGIGTTAAVTAAVVATAGGGGALVEHYGAVPNWKGTAHSAQMRTATNASSVVSAHAVSLAVRRTTVRPPTPAGSNESSISTPHLRLTSRGDATDGGVASSRPPHEAAIRRAPKPPSIAPTPHPARPAVVPPATVDPQPARPSETAPKEKDATPSPGATQPTDGKKTPPGQAKKANAAAISPPAISQPADTAKTPPGRAKKMNDAAPTPGQAKGTDDAATPPGETQPTAGTKTPPGEARKTTVGTAPSDAAAKAHGHDGRTALPPANSQSPPASSAAPTPSTANQSQPTTAGETPPQQPDVAPVPSPTTEPPSPPSPATPSQPDGVPPDAPSNASPGNGKGHGPK
jgi:RNA polymerase sigma factor (sigma-70 family)